MFEKKRRMMMGDNSQDKPQERQLESDKKEVASSVTDSKDSTPPRFSSPVERVPKEKKGPKPFSSVDESAAMHESLENTARQYSDWTDDFWDQLDGVQLTVARHGEEVRTKLSELYDYFCNALNAVSKSSQLTLGSGGLPEFGYCFYNMETKEMEISFDEGVANRYANGAPVSKGRVRWEEFNGGESEEDKEDEEEDKEDEEIYF